MSKACRTQPVNVAEPKKPYACKEPNEMSKLKSRIISPCMRLSCVCVRACLRVYVRMCCSNHLPIVLFCVKLVFRKCVHEPHIFSTRSLRAHSLQPISINGNFVRTCSAEQMLHPPCVEIAFHCYHCYNCTIAFILHCQHCNHRIYFNLRRHTHRHQRLSNS